MTNSMSSDLIRVVSSVLSLFQSFLLIESSSPGVLFTTPHLSVFKTTLEAVKFYVETPASLNASSTSFSGTFVKSKTLGQLAEVRAGKYASHLSTATVATDMMSIINATGYDKLQYWGFS